MRIGVSGRGLVVCALLSGFGALAFSGSAWAQEAKPAAAAEVKPAATEVKPAEGGTKKPEEANMNFITIVTRAGWFGVLIWISLIACSMVMVALVTDCYLTIQEKKLAPNRLVEDVRNSLAQGDLLKALQHCENTPVPLSRILKAGFSNAEEGFEVVQDAVGVAADLEGEKLLQRVTYLSVISNTTPMLGLIGTVQGMIFAFFNLGKMAAGAAQQSMLAINISHGLWATAVGLGTAVPAGIFFFFFKNRATRIILHMEALTLDLIKSLRNVEVVHE